MVNVISETRINVREETRQDYVCDNNDELHYTIKENVEVHTVTNH